MRLPGPVITQSSLVPYTTPATCTQVGCGCRRHPAPVVPLDEEDAST